MNVSEIYCFPIKSLPGINRQSVEITETGVKNDRKWMLVDEDGTFVTLRKDPALTQFELQEHTEYLRVFSKLLQSEIVLPWEHSNLSSMQCSIWDDIATCNRIGDKYDEFFSAHLKRKVHLVSMNQAYRRLKSLNKEPFEASLSFVDGYPITFLSKSSLEYLNNQLSEKIDIRQFRINIILEGGKAFEEDAMQHFDINGTQYSMIKEIRRCVVINMNPETGAKSKEPLKYLSKNRTIDNKVIFGMNAAVLRNGQIHVGDMVELI